MKKEALKQATVLFAGDSGDGIQLTGSQFSDTTARFGNDLSTFPDFPAEIRAPIGTVAGVSGFQINFGSTAIYTPGDQVDVLVAMNVAALVKNLERLKPNGMIIANISGFDKKNMKLAKVEDENILEDCSARGFEVYKVEVTKLTRETLNDSALSAKERDRCKNMFVLGFVYWMYNRSLDVTVKFLQEKFASNPDVMEANVKVLKAGYHYGETAEAFTSRFDIAPAEMESGEYRNITGNHASAIGMVAAAEKAGLPLFYGGYPITPASDVLHFLSRYKHFGVMTFQAEDEIAGICTAIGASFGGSLGTTASSGPGIALKGEALGLAMMLELPLLILNVQRGGPSTGLPTKTEQSDLFQAVYGRNGEAPMPVLAAKSPSDCFDKSYMGAKIAVEHMTPVIVLSDGYIANGAEPWKFPKSEELLPIEVKEAGESSMIDDKHMPYMRDEKLVREWAIPGMSGYEHRIGGLEKQDVTGNVSYDSENHHKMVKLRQAKVDMIADFIPPQKVEIGPEKGKVLVLGWGSTYGTIKSAVRELLANGYEVAHAHIEYIVPFPSNLGEVLKGFDKVIVPELNNGQLVQMIRERYLVDAIPFTKIKGTPFDKSEIIDRVIALYANS